MARLSMEEVARIAYQAGFRGDALVTAVAVAVGESGLNAAARGDVGIQTAKWGPSVGLWQVRSLKGEHGRGTVRDAATLVDPLTNAKAAFAISNGGQNWRPWTVFTKGIYKRHVGQARQIVGAINFDDGRQVQTGPAQPPDAESAMQPQAQSGEPLPMDDQALFQRILTDVADHVAGGKRQLPKVTPTEITLEELFPTRTQEAPDAA